MVKWTQNEMNSALNYIKENGSEDNVRAFDMCMDDIIFHELDPENDFTNEIIHTLYFTTKESLPLFINDESEIVKLIVQWRLKVGR